MHRQVAIAILAAAVLVPGLQAQMRSGGVRGYSRGAARVSPGFAGRGGMPAGRPLGGASGFRGGTWGHGGGTWGHGGGNWVHGTGTFQGGRWGGNRFFHHHHRFFFNSFGCVNGFCNNACFNGFCNFGFSGLPVYYVPPIWPTFDNGPDYGMQAYGAAPAPAPAAYPSEDTTGLQVQIQHLTDEVEQLREEQREHIQAQQPPAAPARPSRMDLPTVLVFRDGRVKEVQNYGIVGQTLWILDAQRAKKVPLSELDLAATKNANDDRGGFVLPQGR